MSKKSFRNPQFFDELIGKAPSPVEPAKVEPATVEGIQVQPPEERPAPPARQYRKITVYFDPQLAAECKLEAYNHRMPVTKWMEQIVRQALAEAKKSREK